MTTVRAGGVHRQILRGGGEQRSLTAVSSLAPYRGARKMGLNQRTWHDPLLAKPLPGHPRHRNLRAVGHRDSDRSARAVAMSSSVISNRQTSNAASLACRTATVSAALTVSLMPLVPSSRRASRSRSSSRVTVVRDETRFRHHELVIADSGNGSREASDPVKLPAQVPLTGVDRAYVVGRR